MSSAATEAAEVLRTADESNAGEVPVTKDDEEAYIAAASRLHAPFDPDQIRMREGAWNNKTKQRDMYSYVPWFVVNDRLDEACPVWQYHIKSITFQPGMRRATTTEKEKKLDKDGLIEDTFIIVVAAVTIYGVEREGIGMGLLSDEEMGIKGAESDALKRAATKHGVARAEVYGEDVAMGAAQPTTQQPRAYSQPSPKSAPQDAQAKNLEELRTPAQLNLLNRHAAEAGVNLEAECQALLNTPLDKISKKAASYLIDHMRSITASERKPLSSTGNVAKPAQAKAQELPGTQVQVRELKPQGDRLGDFIMFSQDGKNTQLGESVPDIPRPMCDCKPPSPCRWVSGKKAEGNTSFGMFCCSYPRKDERNCKAMFNKRGERVSPQAQ
jgi:hypothetical protein